MLVYSCINDSCSCKFVDSHSVSFTCSTVCELLLEEKSWLLNLDIGVFKGYVDYKICTIVD